MSSLILVCMMLVAAIGVGLVGAELYLSSSDSLRTLALDNVADLVQSSAVELDREMRDVRERTVSFISDEEVYRQLNRAYFSEKTLDSKLLDVQRKLSPLIDKYFSGIDSLYTINLVTDRFVFNETSEKPVSVDPDAYRASELYKAALASGRNAIWVPTFRFSDMFRIDQLQEVKLPYERLFALVRTMRVFYYDISTHEYIRLEGAKSDPVLVLAFYPRFFDRFFADQRVMRFSVATVTDSAGRIVYSSDPDQSEEMMPKEWVGNVLSGGAGRGVYSDSRERLLYYTYPIGENEWYITVTMPEDAPAREVLDSLAVKVVTVIGILLVVICTLTLYLRRFIMRPIHKMQCALIRLGEGDFLSPIPEDTYREFADLACISNFMRNNIRRLIHENYEVKLSERNAEIAALNMQLNPHFLYNTLNIIDWMIDAGAYQESRETIRILSTMLRYTSDNTRSMSSLHDDLNWLDCYIRIVSARFSRSYCFQIDVPRDLRGMRVPKLFLQPFVENALLHGLKGRETGMVRISATSKGGMVTFEVFDNGSGIAPEKLRTLMEDGLGASDDAHNIGIQNVHRRLRLLYGKDYGVRLTSEVGRYTIVHIDIPLSVSGGPVANI